jgi:hypothetical protein
MMRMISRAVASMALLAMTGTFCAADEFPPRPAPPPAPVQKLPWEPVFTDTQLKPGAGAAVNGLQMKITADRLVLPETPGSLGQPLIIQPTVLHLVFTNVSGQPIVLDAYNLILSRLVMIVVGPDKQTVGVTRRPLTVTTRAALPIDYPQMEPGNSWGPFETPPFPGDFNLLINYSLFQPGEYKVQVIYSRPPAGAPEIGVWQGLVVSNTLTFRIEGPPPPKPPETNPPNNSPQPAPQSTPQPAPQPTPQRPASPAGTPS